MDHLTILIRAPGATPFSIMTLSIMTLSIMTLSIMTLSIMTLSIPDLFAMFRINYTHHSNTQHNTLY